MSNTATRVLVSIIAIPMIIAACYLGKIYFFLFVLGIALISFYEFYVMVKNKEANINFYFGFFAVWFMVINNYLHLFDSHSFLIIVVLVATLIELFRNNGSAIINVGVTLLGIFYIGLFSSALIDLRELYPNVGDLYLRGGYLLIAILVTIWICDSAAYFGGISLGKHKLFPRVSPNKSWEGAIFGFVFAILSMSVSHYVILKFISLNESYNYWYHNRNRWTNWRPD